MTDPASRPPVTPDPAFAELREHTQPDKKGRCPGRGQVPFNGLCWLEHSGLTGEECEEQGYLYIKGRSYAPVFTPQGKRQPTSDPLGVP